MRCFKSFFKHTWHPQQMDNPARLGSETAGNGSANETELGEIKPSPEAPPPPPVLHGIPCRSGACRSSGLADKGRPERRLDNPWHYLKTLFLVSIIAAFLVWILAYVLLSQYYEL